MSDLPGNTVLNTRTFPTFAIMAAAALLTFAEVKAQAAEVSYKVATVDSIKIFYREAGDPSKPTVLLLHGFPSSSHQFRDLIPLLSDNFHVVAPDYPGMGYSEAPPAEKFTPTFDDLTTVMTDLVEKLGDKRLIVYMTDFGGPVGMRMAVSHPDWISGLVFQNANISLDGVDPARLKRNQENAEGIAPARRAEAEAHVSMATALLLYKQGTRNPAALNPDAWTNDEHALLDPQSRRIMTDLQLDTPGNIALFPVWQDYMRTRRPKSLGDKAIGSSCRPARRPSARSCRARRFTATTPATSRSRKITSTSRSRSTGSLRRPSHSGRPCSSLRSTHQVHIR